MKSETTKTNVPAGKLDACRTSARRQPSSDCGPAAPHPARRRSARRGRGRAAAAPARASAAGRRAARRRRARRPPRPSPGRSTAPPPSVAARLVEPRAAAARRAPSAAAGRRRARPAARCRRRTRGRRTRPCPGRRTVAPRHGQSIHVRRSPGRYGRVPGDLVALAAPWAPVLAEANTDEPSPRDEGERDARPPGSPALRRCPRLPVRLRPRNPLQAGREDAVEQVARRSRRCRSARRPRGSAGGRRRGRTAARCRRRRRSRALRRAPGRAPSARAPGCRGPTRRPRSTSIVARAADELDGPPLQQRVDVDLLDGGEQRRRARRSPIDRAKAVEGMSVQLRVDDRELLVERRIARARSGSGSGRAGPRAAGTSPPARSCSRSRSTKNGSGSGCVTPSTVT